MSQSKKKDKAGQIGERNIMYDVIIIGGGVSGCAAAMELSRYKLRILLLEKEEDVCSGTSKANSAIVHAGFDAPTGSLMARLNVEGSKMMPRLAEELDFSYINNGSLVVCPEGSDISGLAMLKERGEANGVKRLRILEREEALELEPKLDPGLKAALYAPGGGITDPFGMNIAFAENAFENGVEFEFNAELKSIEKTAQGFVIKGGDKVYESRVVINAAGVYADTVHNMISENKMRITPRRGSYMLLDVSAGKHIRHTVFKLPDEKGKGVLVTPTVHGNLLIGPTAVDLKAGDKESSDTAASELRNVIEKSRITVRDIPYKDVITSFAGLRAAAECGDFIIEELKEAPGFIDCAGIQSPGLSAAPAIGKMTAELVLRRLPAERKSIVKKTRNGGYRLKLMSPDERNALIKKNSLYGNIVCRCCEVSEGEIVDCIRRPLGARSLDGVKRRTGACMGRCQAGFCSPKIIEILARELGCRPEAVLKNSEGSYMLSSEGRSEDALR